MLDFRRQIYVVLNLAYALGRGPVFFAGGRLCSHSGAGAGGFYMRSSISVASWPTIDLLGLWRQGEYLQPAAGHAFVDLERRIVSYFELFLTLLGRTPAT